jgi:hypothetical protein
MDQGVIAFMKWCYWADLLRNLADEADNIIALGKRIMLDAIYGVSQAWFSVNPVMLVQLWRKLLPDLDEDDLQGFSNKSGSLKFLTCVLWEVLKMLTKIMLKNGYKWCVWTRLSAHDWQTLSVLP